MLVILSQDNVSEFSIWWWVCLRTLKEFGLALKLDFGFRSVYTQVHCVGTESHNQTVLNSVLIFVWNKL